MSLLSCHNLSVGYGGVKILEDLNFSVERGDYLCILGENGAGKSTLMKTLLQLIPPEGGTIEVCAEKTPMAGSSKQTWYMLSLPSGTWLEEAEGVSMNTRSSKAWALTARQGLVVVVPTII